MSIADNTSIHSDASQRVRQAIYEYGIVTFPFLPRITSDDIPPKIPST